jgi:hypothetical protein
MASVANSLGVAQTAPIGPVSLLPEAHADPLWVQRQPVHLTISSAASVNGM